MISNIDDYNLLQSLKKQIDFLDSHKTLELINEKQYNEALAEIVSHLAALEKKHNVDSKEHTVNGNLEKIQKTLGEIKEELVLFHDSFFREANLNEDEVFDAQVHAALMEVDTEEIKWE